MHPICEGESVHIQNLLETLDSLTSFVGPIVLHTIITTGGHLLKIKTGMALRTVLLFNIFMPLLLK